MSFLIHELSFNGNEKDRRFKFNIDDMRSNIVFSILIGANGTGKSFLLGRLVNIFRDLEAYTSNFEHNPVDIEYYYIKYQINTTVYIIEKNSEGYHLGENTIQEDIIVPSAILALTFLVEDKFTYQSEKDNNKSIYKYLGIRNTGNAVFLGSISKKIMNILFENIENSIFRKKVSDTFNLLGYEAKVLIKFEHILKSMISKKVTIKTINSRINTIAKKSKYKNKKLDSITDENKKEMITFIREMKGNRDKSLPNNIFFELNVNFDKKEDSYSKYKIIKNMITVGLLRTFDIEISHKNSNINAESLSSGEKSLLFITLNILAQVKDNSLILIDEPEISLHPNWQIKYNLHLKKILSGYKNIHIVIATHSHFLLSGLKKNEANVFSIMKNKKVVLFKDDTYGWSPENILYNIFNMASTRNYYFERDLKKLVFYISNKEGTISEISSILDKLSHFNIREGDPLYEVIRQGREYLKNRNNNV